MRRIVCCLFLLVAFAAMAPAPGLAAEGAKTLFVRCGKLIYDTEKPPIVNADVIITGGKITAVGQHFETVSEIPAELQVATAAGKA